MRVKVINGSIRSAGKTHATGAEIDIKEADALRLIDAGWAEYVEPSEAEPQKKPRGRPPKL